MRKDRMRKNIWTLFLPMLLCMTGCAAKGNGALNELNCRPADCAYELKEITMLDGQTGWALSTENETLFTGKGVENFAVVKETVETGKGTEDFISASFVNEETAYLVYFAPDDLHLVVEFTGDGGKTWQKTLVDYGSFGDTCDAGSAYISFVDDQKGYLLYCSTPGAGLMTKILLGTEDGGRTFSVIKDLSEEIESYPQGLTFAGERGYIAVSYHGNENYLYMSTDGGRTWENEIIDSADSDINYIDSYAPAFCVADSSRGMIVLKEVGDEISFRLFTTKDGGDNWMGAGDIAGGEVKAYSPVGDTVFFFINEMGELYEAER